MFVSSFNTYISTNSSNKSDNYKDRDFKSDAESFSSELSKSTILKPYINKNLPIDYVSNYKSFNNQQKLYEQLQNQNGEELKKLNILNNAKVAYEESTKMFSLLKRPTLTLSQTPKIDEKLPRDAQEAKEKSLRHTMVNTYLANDNYYRVTAA
ncbi:MAG: hypothetical protein PHQ93_03980 [Sulfurimonas sp.]|uniref:hypothetical protein n=1 Tax=Sulfurimonas sp. TaxID=2022749 RepID=UPI0026249EBC|nr:hypothetical protein [Sulfurimonas sp.]MDD5400331.1 hypothetical protein [Sulfurimonas sp.]